MTLHQLNHLAPPQAEAEFLKCCGSRRWARLMSSARPFRSVEELFQKAEELCRSLSEEDWLEAFRAHPQIGERTAAAAQSEQAHRWSAQEQSGVQDATSATKAALVEGNREYQQRFGFIFIVCATGKSSEEIFRILQSRLRNDRAVELRIAADEQRKIAKLRLEKLLNQ